MNKFDAEIVNIIREMAITFGVTSEKRIAAYAQKLYGSRPDHVAKAASYFIENENQFPSYAVFKEHIRLYSFTGEDTEKVKVENETLEKENNRLNLIREKFNEIIGEASLQRYVKYWCAGVFGNDFISNLEAQKMNFMLFEKPALIDLAEASMNPQRAIDIGNRKQKNTIVPLIEKNRSSLSTRSRWVDS